jgi:hypothetical protein
VWEEKHADSEKMKLLSKEMDEVVKKMRWVMNLKQNTDLGGNAKD